MITINIIAALHSHQGTDPLHSLTLCLTTTMDATQEQLNALFPHPGDAEPPNVVARRVPAPVRQAGWTDDSTKAVLTLLKENHQRWHIFFNDEHYHKYVSRFKTLG